MKRGLCLMTKMFFSIFIFQALITIFFIFGGLYLLYLLFLVIRAFTELRSLPYMSKFFLLASRPLVFKVFRCQNQCLAKNIPHLPIKVLLTSLLLGAQIVPFKKKEVYLAVAHCEEILSYIGIACQNLYGG